MEEEFLSITSFVPTKIACSNSERRCHCEHRWLACQCSGRPSVSGKKNGVPAFGGQMRRSFELRFDLNRPSQPRLSDLASELRQRRPHGHLARRSDKWA